MWYSPMGLTITLVVGYLMSVIFNLLSTGRRIEPDPSLFTPLVARRIRRRRANAEKRATARCSRSRSQTGSGSGPDYSVTRARPGRSRSASCPTGKRPLISGSRTPRSTLFTILEETASSEHPDKCFDGPTRSARSRSLVVSSLTDNSCL